MGRRKAEKSANFSKIRDAEGRIVTFLVFLEISLCASTHYIVVWFDTVPLILDKRIELVSNPNRVSKGNFYVDMSVEFSKIIGKKFTKYKFSDAGCVSMFFENDIKLVLSNNWTCDVKDIVGYLGIKSKFAPNKAKK